MYWVGRVKSGGGVCWRGVNSVGGWGGQGV